MGYIIYNGYNSSDDLIITRPLIRPTWGAEINEITRPGAPRKLMQVSKSYANEQMTIEAALFEATPERVRKVYQALSGHGQLVLSSAPDEILTAYIRPLIPEAVALQTAVYAASVTLMPFAYAAEPTVATVGTSYTTITNSGTIYSAPEIRLTPSAAGEIVIDTNGSAFTLTIPAELTSKELIIDSDAEVTYYMDGEDKVSVNYRTEGSYPLLHLGDNYIKYSGSVTGDVTINVRERWL